MARTINEDEHAVRRNEILDVTQRLIYTKGYEQMTIQDVLDELKISKGAFYHYFRSKQDLMECMIERMMEEGLRFLRPIVDDESLPALEKLQLYFDSAVQWKSERKAELLAILRVWYADENAIVRQKVYAASNHQFAPVLTEIVQQGVREGTIRPAFPDQVAGVFMALMQGFGDNVANLFLQLNPANLNSLMATVASYTDAMERILGVPHGTLKLIDEKGLKAWVTQPDFKNSHRES